MLAAAYFLSSLYGYNTAAAASGDASVPEDANQNVAVMQPLTNDFASEKVLTVQETTQASDITDAHVTGTWTSYEILCDSENELLMKLKTYSETLYQHALRIGDLSCRAAKEIGADEKVAFAGGLYHEIGKINGKNYIEEGLLIAEEYSFPKELRSVIKEHNIKYDKPSSVAAAIVMLSDSIESTIEYIEKTGEHKFTNEKIIDNIFQMRMEKGTFDSSGLSLKDYKKLKDFFQKEYSSR